MLKCYKSVTSNQRFLCIKVYALSPTELFAFFFVTRPILPRFFKQEKIEIKQL